MPASSSFHRAANSYNECVENETEGYSGVGRTTGWRDLSLPGACGDAGRHCKLLPDFSASEFSQPLPERDRGWLAAGSRLVFIPGCALADEAGVSGKAG